MKVCAVVVTYNRLVLLKECLNALDQQTLQLENIVVVDNHSTDGTDAYLVELQQRNNKVIHRRMNKNVGGAGGFYEGLRIAYETNADFFWLMDDDTIAFKDALEQLVMVAKQSTDCGFVCSHVIWKDGEACNMNTPGVTTDWNRYLNKGIIKVRNSSFVSVLFNKRVLEEVGYPLKEFFIWGDDTEFTRRIQKRYTGYMAVNSIVLHKMDANHGVDLLKESNERIGRHFYRYRNKMYIARTQGVKEVAKYLFGVCRTLLLLKRGLTNHKLKKARIVITGVLSGLFFSPRIEFPIRRK